MVGFWPYQIEETEMNEDDLITVNCGTFDNDLDTSIVDGSDGYILTCTGEGEYTWTARVMDDVIKDIIEEQRVRGRINHGKTKQKRCYE